VRDDGWKAFEHLVGYLIEGNKQQKDGKPKDRPARTTAKEKGKKGVGY